MESTVFSHPNYSAQVVSVFYCMQSI
uniref:Uncharacterized protein n=1 Tax=Arundo donax TaxID=35708 RepID=A0A0A9Q7L3_ARUDO